MITHDYTIAQELKRRLSSVVKIEDFRVFGSRARKDNDKYSDLDVYIVVEKRTQELEKKIFDISWEVGYENYIIISTLIFTLDEIRNSPLRSSPIVKVIQEQGIPV